MAELELQVCGNVTDQEEQYKLDEEALNLALEEEARAEQEWLEKCRQEQELDEEHERQLLGFVAVYGDAVEPIPYFSSVLKGVSLLNNNKLHLMVFQITMSAVREWATSHGSKLSEKTVTLTSGYGIIEAQSFVDWGRREG
ncbi:hypothetical protein Tco_0414203 [Tanacetum coccineum]